MVKLPFYIITSDATSDILPTSCFLFNKYWGSNQEFKVLGNHEPKWTMPENFKFIKIKNENNIQKWTRYIYEYIKNNETAEYFLFSLDDYLPNANLKPEILENILSYAKKTKKVGRISLARLDVEKWEIVENSLGYDIVELKTNSPYRISCQISIWNREYFLKYFEKDWTPWQLELEGSKYAQTDGWKVLGTNRDWAFGWLEESALSGRWPGMVNVLGLQLEDIKYCLEKKNLKLEQLQYGIWYDCKIPFLSRFQSISKRLTKIPKFSQVGLGFKWNLIKPYVRNKTYKRLQFRYKNFYPEK